MRTADAVVAALTALRELDGTPGMAPTAHQIGALREFPGWGPVAPIFDDQPPASWEGHAAAVEDAAGGLDLDGPRAVVDTSFYTPFSVVDRMWDLLRATGFDGGRVLDVGCGTGRFLDGAPAGLPVMYTGVDPDPIAVRIGSLLHPTATFIEGAVPKVAVGVGFDGAIGNVPFSSAKVFVPGSGGRLPLHVACILQIMQAVRPGAHAVIATSRFLIDGATIPTPLADIAELVTAVRLPSGTFAGTDTVADVVVLRAHSSPGRMWPTSGRMQIPADGNTTEVTEVSEYWATRRRLVAGTMCATGFSQSPLRVTSTHTGRDIARAFTEAARALPQLTCVTAADLFASVPLADSAGRAEGSFHIVDGSVVRVVNGRLAPVMRPSRELRALIGLRDAAKRLIEAESDWNAADAALEPIRTRTAELYSQYVDAFGPLNRGTLREGKVDPETGSPRLSWHTPTMGGFRNDPDAVVVFSLEGYDRDTEEASPAPILSHRVNRRPVRATAADTPAEALAISRGEGGIDLARIAQLLHLTDPDAAFDALGDLVYRDPANRAVVYVSDYLSGNVRAKLATAQVAAATDAGYNRNVEALQSVLPGWLGPKDIRLELGSPLIATADVEAFCREVLESGFATVTYEPLTARWEVQCSSSPAARAMYGTNDKEPTQLLQSGLNGKIPVVTRTVPTPDHGTRTVRDRNATESAVVALGKIATRFSTWLWEDPVRSTRLEHAYNWQYNAHVPRTADGSHLRMPRLAVGQKLWPWQRDWIDHALSVPAAYNAIECGLGKTASALGLAMTLRELGVVNKPMIAVPNHLIEDVAVAAHQFFPSARILTVSRNDLAGGARRLFAARCATGDWDAIIITHEGLQSFPMTPAVEREWLTEQLMEARGHYWAAGHNAKSTATRVRSLEGRLDALRATANDPGTVFFDHLGVDHLSVDEADKYRRLPVYSTADGFSTGSSTRAADLALKVWWLRRQAGHRPHYAAYSATPFVNSLAETYVALRFCAPGRLAESGVAAFDAFAATFIRQETIIEVSPDGSGFRSTRRPAVIQNVPELRAMIRSFMFFKRAADTGLPLPAARFHTIVAEPSQAAVDYMHLLAARADAIRGLPRTAAAQTDDNMLKVCTDGRRLGLDIELVPGQLPEPAGTVTKLVMAADNIARHYHATRDVPLPNSDVPGLFQLVMCDLGTPRPGDTQTYGRLRSLLVARGVPAGHIRFAHDATTPKARQALFRACREGTLPILLASTSLAGIGANLQTRLTALHHVDLTWHAAAYEQRNGRAIRFGNLTPGGTVDIYSYVTARTFDGFTAGLIVRKKNSFDELYRPDSTVREIDDVGDVVLNYAQIRASASGNSLLLRQHELAATVRALQVERATVLQNAVAARRRGDDENARADELRQRRRHIEGLLPHKDALIDSDWDFTDHIATIGNLWQTRVRANQGGLYAQVRRTLGQTQLVLSTAYSGHEVARLPVPSRVTRRSRDGYARWLTDATRAWVRGLSEHLVALDAEIAAAAAAAAAAWSAADTVTFDRQAELDAAVAHLDEITETITEQAA